MHTRSSRRAGRQTAVWPLVLVTALTLSGCANPIESILTEALGTSNSDSFSESTQTQQEGMLPGVSQGEVPTGFPDVVPLPKQKPTRAAHHTEDGIDVWALHYHELEEPAEFEALGQELLSRGFVEESNTSMGDKMRLALYVNDDYTVNLSLLGDEGDQIMQIMVMNQVAQ